MNTKVEEMTAKEQGLPEGLEADIDAMRDVYMLPSQRGAYERILARAATYKIALASDTGERGAVDLADIGLSLIGCASIIERHSPEISGVLRSHAAALRAQPDGAE